MRLGRFFSSSVFCSYAIFPKFLQSHSVSETLDGIGKERECEQDDE